MPSRNRERQPSRAWPANSPLSAVDLLQGIDRHLALSEHALELPVLGLKRPQALQVSRLERSELLAPGVDRLFADLVLARDLSDRASVGFAQIASICSSVKRIFFMDSLASGGSLFLKLSVVQKNRAGQSGHNRRVDDASPLEHQPLAGQVSVDAAKDLRGKLICREQATEVKNGRLVRNRSAVEIRLS
jgi:hypothetical protein